MTLARRPSGVPVRTTVHTYEGHSGGPTIYVQAAQHGREVNGTEVLRRFHDRLDPADLSGTVVAVPVANPLTFDLVSYTTPEAIDSVNANMNRVWPGDADGSIHQQMAARLWEFVEDADAVVDLHTGNEDMLTHVVHRQGHGPSRELAAAFGTELALAEPADDAASDEWHRRGFAGKLRVAAVEAGIPAITPELAHARVIDDEAVETGVEGLFRVLRSLGLLEGSVEPVEQTVARNHLGRVKANAAGIYRPAVALELGQFLPAGADLGRVYDPGTYAVRHDVSADREGILYAIRRKATVNEGDQLASVAIPIDDADE